jgi:hypothetical protein
MRRNFARSSCLVVVALAAGCGGGSSNGPSYPAVAPIVNAALPATLQSTTTSADSVSLFAPRAVQVGPPHVLTTTPGNAPSGEMTKASGYIQAMFTNYYSNINNGKAYQGFINNMVLNVDMRMSGISQMSSNGKCTSATPQSYVVDLSSIDSMLKFTLADVQCDSAMSGNAAGSGLVFGQSGTNYSMWLSLGGNTAGATYATTGGFMLFANVLNYGSTSASAPESVDGMFVAYSPAAQNNQITISRFKASPTTKTFELFFGANQTNNQGFKDTNTSDGNGTDSQLGSGFRMISDGTHIYSDGLMFDSPSYYNYNICMNASDLSLDATTADCQTLANSFTLNNTSASLNFAEVTGNAGATYGANPGTGALTPCSGSSLSGCVPGPTSNSQQTAPTAAIITLLTNTFPVSNASSVTTSF